MPIMIRVIPFLIVLFAAPLQAAGVLTQSLPASTAGKLTATRLSLMAAGTPWDAGRGIYQTPVAGLGLSLCNRAGDRCLTQNTPWIPGDAPSAPV